MAKEAHKPKIGKGHAQAMRRAGLKELAQILPAFPDSVKPVEEPGLFGNPVSHEVYEQRHKSKDGPTKEMEMGM
jgi:hypothetical protein